MALDVINLMRESMLDTLTDEFGTIDFGRTGGASKKGRCAMRSRTLPCALELGIASLRLVAMSLCRSSCSQCVCGMVQESSTSSEKLSTGRQRHRARASSTLTKLDKSLQA